MRILLVANPDPDYTQDVVYHGLVQLLGARNVLEHPYTPRYHEPPRADVGFPMLYLDVRDEGPRGELSEMLEWADAVIIGSLHKSAYDVAREVLRLAPEKPTAYLDGADDSYIHEIARHVDVYFKREVPLRRRLQTPLPLQKLFFRFGGAPQWQGPLREVVDFAVAGDPRIVPLPFGVIDHGQRAVREKTYDVAFMGLPTSRERARLRRDLDALARQGVRVFAPEERLSWWDYLEVLGRTRVGISLRGHGFDTYRYWEIPALGTMLLAETPRIVIPENFEHAEEAWFADPARMPDAVREVLAMDTERIAAAGHRKLLASHTSSARAQTVLDHLRPHVDG